MKLQFKKWKITYFFEQDENINDNNNKMPETIRIVVIFTIYKDKTFFFLFGSQIKVFLILLLSQ